MADVFLFFGGGDFLYGIRFCWAKIITVFLEEKNINPFFGDQKLEIRYILYSLANSIEYWMSLFFSQRLDTLLWKTNNRTHILMVGNLGYPWHCDTRWQGWHRHPDDFLRENLFCTDIWHTQHGHSWSLRYPFKINDHFGVSIRSISRVYTRKINIKQKHMDASSLHSEAKSAAIFSTEKMESQPFWKLGFPDSTCIGASSDFQNPSTASAFCHLIFVVIKTLGWHSFLNPG